MEPKHALIIDDDAYNIYIMERFLDRENIAYTAVTDTNTLQDTLDGLTRVDLILLDLEMPRQDGYEVIEILRQQIDPSIPIIACTVHTAEINRTKRLGFSGFIAKPLDMERFSEQISRILTGEAIWEGR